MNRDYRPLTPESEPGVLDPSIPPGSTQEYARAQPRRRPAGRSGVQWLVNAAVAAAVLLAVFLARRPQRASAESAAMQELHTQVETGERLIATASVSRRRPADFFRTTFGVVGATDRRLVFVGVLPTLVRVPGSPPPFESRVFAYDTTMRLEARRVPLQGERGLMVALPDRTVEFDARSTDWPLLSGVIEAANGQIQAQRRFLLLEQQYQDSIRALPPLEEHYVVQRGDALLSIAARFDVPPDQIVRLNSLPGDQVRAGVRLLIRVTERVAGPCPPETCGVPAFPTNDSSTGR